MKTSNKFLLLIALGSSLFISEPTYALSATLGNFYIDPIEAPSADEIEYDERRTAPLPDSSPMEPASDTLIGCPQSPEEFAFGCSMAKVSDKEKKILQHASAEWNNAYSTLCKVYPIMRSLMALKKDDIKSDDAYELLLEVASCEYNLLCAKQKMDSTNNYGIPGHEHELLMLPGNLRSEIAIISAYLDHHINTIKQVRKTLDEWLY